MTTPCPTIHVYGSATAPETHRWMATLFRPTLPSKKQEERGIEPGEAFLPIHFFSPDKETARAAAADWWAAEQDRLAKREAGYAARTAAARAARTNRSAA